MGIETPKTESGDERIRNPNVAEVVARAEKEYQDLLRSEEADLTPEERKIVEEMSAKAGTRAEKHARGHLDFEGLISAMELTETERKHLEEAYGDRAEDVAKIITEQTKAVKRETFSITTSSDISKTMRMRALRYDRLYEQVLFSKHVGTESVLRSWQSSIRRPRVVDKYLDYVVYNDWDDRPENFLHVKLDALKRYDWARISSLRELLYLSTLDPHGRRKAVDALNQGGDYQWRAPDGYGYSDSDIEQNFKDVIKIAAVEKMILEAKNPDELKAAELINSQEITDEETAVLEDLLPMIEMNRALSPEAAEKVDGVVTQYGFTWNEKIGHYVPEKKEK